MALNTTPGPLCESLASVTQADAYHDSRGNSAAWEALDDSRKEQLLRQAYDHLFGEYAGRWNDDHEFGAVNEVGDVPQLMINASALLALYAIAGPLNGPPSTAPQVVEKTVGPITTKYAAGSAPAKRTFPDVARMVGPYLVKLGNPHIAKLVRS